MMGTRVLHVAAAIALSVALCGCGGSDDTATTTPSPQPQVDKLLERDFCQLYYPADHAAEGLPPCEEVKAAVVAKNDFEPFPVLQLGDPSKPALFFVHGWPDSAAEFASQFGGLCYGPSAKYFCIAPTWQMFHPDHQAFPETDLLLQKTIDWLGDTMKAANLVDPTLVIHDWGSFLGYQLLAQQPDLANRTISFDIGERGEPNKTYQAENKAAYLSQDTARTQAQARYWLAPCVECATWEAAWPYVFNMSLAGLDPQMHPQNKPLLFMWGNQMRGLPRGSDSLFFNETFWIPYVESTPHGKVVEVDGGDHWMFFQRAKFVNEQMTSWLEEVRGASATVTV